VHIDSLHVRKRKGYPVMARDDGTSSRHADDKARFKQYDYMAVRVDKELYLYWMRMYGFF